MFRQLSIGHLLSNERKSQSKNEKSSDDRIEGLVQQRVWLYGGLTNKSSTLYRYSATYPTDE